MARWGYRSPAMVLFPAFLGYETHVLSAGQGSLQGRCGGFSSTVLPALKSALHKADGLFCFLCSLKTKWSFNGPGWGIPHSIMSLVKE